MKIERIPPRIPMSEIQTNTQLCKEFAEHIITVVEFSTIEGPIFDIGSGEPQTVYKYVENRIMDIYNYAYKLGQRQGYKT